MLTKLALGSLVFLLLVFVLILVLFVFKAKESQQSSLYQEYLSSDQRQLKPCGEKPNCVCSEYQDDKSHYIKPWHYKQSNSAIMTNILSVIDSMNGKVIIQKDNYLAIEFKSKLFGFVDDLEIRLDEDLQVMHFRSASRQGHSDFKVNRGRVNKIKARMTQ